MQNSAGERPLVAGMAGCLTVDLAALQANYAQLCGLSPTAQVSAVVKANAYGLGALAVSEALYAVGCRLFFVAHLSEALDLRTRLPADAQLYVLNGLQPGGEALCAAAGIIPVLNSLTQVANWSGTARARGERLAAVLQVDSGMSRLGLSPDEARILAADPHQSSGVDFQFIMSHLACADEPDHPANAGQLEALQTITRLFPDLPVSLANSGGAFLGEAYRYDVMRPGIALYGGAPHAGHLNPMMPVVSLHIPVIQTRTVPAGTAIGYGGTVVTERETRLATLGAGYADGLPRSLNNGALSNNGVVWFGDVRLPIIGRVSMDSIIIDISELPADALTLGSLVEVIGPHQSIDAIAADAGTIAYEILTGLGARFYRDYCGFPISPSHPEVPA